MQSASRSRGRRRRGGARRAPCVPLQALTALPLSEQNDPRTTPTRCDAMRRDADFGKCNCNLLKFVAVAAHRRDTNRRRRRRGPNKTRKTNAAPKKKTNQSHPGKKFRSRFLSRFCVAPLPPLHPTPSPCSFRWSPKIAVAVKSRHRHSFQGLPKPYCAHSLGSSPSFFVFHPLFCIVCEFFLLEMIMTGME